MTHDPNRHLRDAELLELLDGAATLADFAEHLDDCPQCRETLALAHAVAPSREPATMQIGRYELKELLGEGGTGVVYRAWDPAIHRDVALKLWARVSGSAREKLLHEARVMGRLSHPGLCSVHDAGHDPRFGTFIATSLIDGDTLRHWMRGPVAPPDRMRVLLEVADALTIVHDAGVAHGDLKPENIVMRRDGRPVVTDFGLAALEGEGPRGGTEGYAAPEQLRDGATPMADQFAFCTMAEELLPSRRLSPVWARGRREQAEERWPDMHALIAAMNRARRGYRPRLFVASGVLSAAALFVATRVPEPCTLDAAAERASWATQRAAFAPTTLPARQLEAVDRYVEHWSDAADRACQTGEAHVCLMRARAEITALRTRLGTPGLQLAEWVAQLPDPRGCFESEALPGPSPVLIDARAMRRDGDVRGAARAAGRIALTTDDPALAAEAELLRGKSLVGVDATRARESLWRATVSANSEERPDLEAEGLLGLALLEVRDTARVNEAARLLERAERLVMQHRPDLRPAVAFLRGLIASSRGETEASVKSMRRAVELASEFLTADHPFRLQYSFEYALALARAGRYQASIESLESVRTRSQEQLGPNHPRTLNVEVELASQLANVGEWSRARGRLAATITGLEASLGEDSPVVLDTRQSLAVVLYELEDYDTARDQFETLHRANDRANRPYAALDNACLSGDVEAAKARWPAAQERYVDALAYASEHELVGPPIGACLARLGLAQRHLDNPACQATLERAVGMLDLPSAHPLDASLARFELARCTEDPQRARSLAEAALSALSAEGAVADRRREEIEAWLAERS